ncbi:hypothetical protein BN128_807 [Cronobacter sakazakii 696]|uniref:Uncharacterized protein n=1 Tax=Cronobacter sakazakii (strain ATCC BAA-894) TaxID=290339 RepID=A7MMP8_CROS8|nr:hypothetical protein ESA_01939 [Cronobacter sakazakii ATCC BAA-894]CCK06938.1 hypothetical protein BN128_807 [Cronobacter sakazakii 696]
MMCFAHNKQSVWMDCLIVSPVQTTFNKRNLNAVGEEKGQREGWPERRLVGF